ncbi:glycosyltransferase family 2 protein [Flavobacterium hiemivividum]|uniref:Glycosyltransferase n=1 Tax=Flavobacterium hiemivividum TaxID=2541734 RepID=A0A4R5CVU4_9FLAO|nr:glycosyltransferase family 2 protein [Flavobacterium hiemivividum]TDE04576.1 glycosyltransferase [Flavobacterium hiemivividum]
MVLSIITINYNNFDGLKKTVESVINQTWNEFEYIVIDGGSTDGSKEYIESQSSKINYWISEKDSGIYNAMNKGIKVANGQYLLFLNSGDDLIDNDILKTANSKLVDKELVYFDINVIGENAFYVKNCPDFLSFSYLFKETLPHQSTFIKKELFDRVGYYDESLKIVADWKFFIIALTKKEATYKHVDAVLSNFYLDGLSSTNDFSQERRVVLELLFTEYLSDYDELFENRKKLSNMQDYMNSNRLKMLIEIEKTTFGRKFLSYLFRILIVFFSKKKVKEVLNTH